MSSCDFVQWRMARGLAQICEVSLKFPAIESSIVIQAVIREANKDIEWHFFSCVYCKYFHAESQEAPKVGQA